MKKLLYILIIVFTYAYSFAQSADEEIYFPTDTSKKAFHPSKELITYEPSADTDEESDDSEAQNEIAELYGDFNTTAIHQFKYKEVFQNRDSILISFEKDKFVLPVIGKINSHYGWRRYRPHYGTDIDLEKGDSVRVAFDGVVRYANKKVKGYGQVIVIRHFNGLETVYAHLSKIFVSPNDTLKAGTVIGLGGSTGRSTGPHLHFEVRCLGISINSEDIIDYENGTLKKQNFLLTKKDAEETYNLRSKKYHSLAKNKSIYIVKKGDTLSKIARKTGMHLSYLMKKNKLKKTTVLKPGRKLYL